MPEEFRWTREKPLHRVHEESVSPGEVFTPTPGVRESFGMWLEPVESGDDESEESAESGGESEYAAMDYAELRDIAADADTDEINGRSSKDEIVAWLEEHR